MCGIVGIAGFNDSVLIKKMALALQHRGPDDEGFFSDNDVELGHRRLSIIDIKSGKQPIHNEEENIWIIFNGEIYNYKVLREANLKKHQFYTNSDTEVIVHLYEQYGLDFVKYLNGIFAFAIYDAKNKKIILARDRMGTKPLYYFFDKKRKAIIFASELKSLLLYKEIPKETDIERVKEYIQFGFITAPNTILKEVKKLEPAQILIFDLKLKKIYEKKYWDFNFKEEKKDFLFYKKTFLDSFQQSVNDQLMSEVPLGVYLSGGLDSSSIVALIKNLYPDRNLKTFSVGFGTEEVVNELSYAEKVAKAFNTEHKEIIVKDGAIKELPQIAFSLDEPINNLSAVPLYNMARVASKKIKVVLTGNGSDELFAGYMQHRFIKFSLENKRLLNKLYLALRIKNKFLPKRKSIFLQKFIEKLDNPSEAYKILKYNEPNKEIFDEPYQKIIKSDNSIKKIFNSKFSLLNNLTLIELKKLLPENYLMVDDKINMHFGIESRVPFLDNRMISLSEKIPSSLKANLFRGKILLRKVMKEYLPKHTIKRKKYGFTAPATLWFNKNLNEIQEQLLTPSPITNFLNKNKIEEMLTKHSTQDINTLWNLLIGNLWSRQYIWGEKIRKL